MRFPTHRGAHSALIEADTGSTCSYDELARLVHERTSSLDDLEGGVAFLGVVPSIGTVVEFLALLEVGATTALVDPTLDREVIEDWIAAYRPELVTGLPGLDRRAPRGDAVPELQPRDAILLATSGSTGSPKFVRLSRDNILANARQIAAALSIDQSHRGFAHLPLFYSYGLSVLTSHLVVGATVVLTSASAIRPEFWDAIERYEVTSLPGVPYNFEMYRRMKLVERDLPHLMDVTQAGGRLNPERIREFHDGLATRGKRLWIMYGQTEATARITVLPADELGDHVGSVGYPLPEGSVEIHDPDEFGAGEIVYEGPNVMLGYAESRDDLQRGDTLGGQLFTGDLGWVDQDGRLWITGRSKRIAKVVGVRMNLDDLERRLATLKIPVAVVASDPGITVFYEAPDEIASFAKSCERTLGLPPRTVNAVRLEQLPTTSAGKISYQELSR